MLQYYSVKQKHTSTERGLQDYKVHSTKYFEIIRIRY